MTDHRPRPIDVFHDECMARAEAERAPAASSSVVVSADRATLRDRIRRAICEAEGFGFAWGTNMLEPDEYGEVADAVLAVLPAPAPCAECGHPKATHRPGDDPVTPGECSACHPDEARHDHQGAVGEQPDTQTREADDPTQCSGDEGFCPEHGFHRHSLKQPGTP